MAFTSPSLSSVSTGADNFCAALQIATRVSWLSTLNAPTAKCSFRERAINSRAFIQLWRISLIVIVVSIILSAKKMDFKCVKLLFIF